MKNLFIDTSSNEQIIIALEVDGVREEMKKDVDKRKSQVILTLIDNLLKRHKIEASDLTAITVNTGPGSFTGLRVGVAVANTLGLILRIPINNNPPGKTVEPEYSS